MTFHSSESLPDEARLAIAHTRPILRDALRIFLEFDQRLGRLVSATTEPILGQMRLAWWRDMLGMPIDKRPKGDVVLDGLSEHWPENEAPLITLIDGWEYMLSAPPMPREAVCAFAKGRAEGLAGLACVVGADEAVNDNMRKAAEIWAVADAASHMAEGAERSLFLAIGQGLTRPQNALPAPFRGIAVLSALGERSLKAGGAPLMAGRGAALTALKAGLFGR